MTPLGTGMVKDLNPFLARHVCVLVLAAAATEAADEACLLLLAWAAMPLSWAVVSRLHTQRTHMKVEVFAAPYQLHKSLFGSCL